MEYISELYFSPDAEDDLQQGAQARDKENGINEATLDQAVVLQAQPLRQDERDGDDPTERRQVMLRGGGAVRRTMNRWFWMHTR